MGYEDDIEDIDITANSLLFGRTPDQRNVISTNKKNLTNCTTNKLFGPYTQVGKVYNELWNIWKRNYLSQTQRINKFKGKVTKWNLC